MASSKEKLAQNIKNWLQVDKEIQVLQKELKDRKKKKNDYASTLMQTMKANEIDCFDINGGALVYKKNTVKKPINGKSLLSVLTNFYKNDPKMAENITKFVLENREEQIKETIKRKIDK